MNLDNMDVRLKILLIALPFIALIIWSHYEHRNEPHWAETRYVKIIK